MEQTVDIETPLNQVEAGRVKTEFERIHGKQVKYRFLTGYSPRQIAAASTVRVKPEDIARYAGRTE